MKTFFNKKFLWFYLLIIIVTFVIVVKPVIQGAIPFWNDPARDLLLAWDNLKKLTLIGPTSGIPGIFYGPQWIWILSAALIFSRDPRWVVFLTATLPYFIILPFLFYQLTKDLFSKKGAVIMWLFFIFAFGSYASQLWSPNLAPLFFFCILYLFYKSKYILEAKNIKNFFLIAILLGLLLNHLISFGVGACFTFAVYFLITLVLSFFNKTKRKISLVNWLVNFTSFAVGFLVINGPFLLFEIRHGFFQLKSLLFTLNQGVVHNTSVVNKIGLTKIEIILRSIERLTELLSLPNSLAGAFVIIVISVLIIILKTKNRLNKDERRFIYFLLLNYFGIMFVYLTAKNPIWNYHFIGFEIIFLILLGIMINKVNLAEKLLFYWSIVILTLNLYKFITNFNNNRPPELLTKKANVEHIYQDANGKAFGYFAKNAAIYTFDYDYVFRWVGRNYNYIPKPNSADNVKIVYLIIPREYLTDREGFTDNRTSNKIFKTVKKWQGKDQTLIIKRVID